MTPTRTAPEHLDDGALVRIADADAAPLAAERAHVDACTECAARLASVRRRSVRLSAVLARADLPLPALSIPGPASATVIPLRRAASPRPAVPGWMRVAAVVLATLGLALAASPARAWIGEWIAAHWPSPETHRPAAARAPVRPPPAARRAPAGSRVEFAAPAGEFRLEIAHPQKAGALTLEATAEAGASAEVVGGTGSADLMVLPAGLRIGNTAGSTADYRIALPASVRTVRLRIGGGPARTIRASELGSKPLRVDLGAR
jgi:hypothetical protein